MGAYPRRDQNSICLYRNCYSGPSKCGSWALARERVLAQDTTVCVRMYVCVCVCVCVGFKGHTADETTGVNSIYHLIQTLPPSEIPAVRVFNSANNRMSKE